MRFDNVLKILNQVIDCQYKFRFFYHKHEDNYNLAYFYIIFFSKNIYNTLLFRILMLIYDIDRFKSRLLP